MATPRLHARPPADEAEQRTLRTLAAARQAPASWVQRARIITGSWDGASVTELALRLGCTTKTVYKWLHRFNTLGIDGLADAPAQASPDASASTTAAASSPWPAVRRRAGWFRAAKASWRHRNRPRRRSGPWMP